MYHLIFLALAFLKGCQSSDWSYVGDNGPKHWCDHFKSCCGNRQSPIDLRADFQRRVYPFSFVDYGIPNSAQMVNNGHSVAVVPSSDKKPKIMYGGLNGTYALDGFHFHWGSSAHHGSEHTVNGLSYPMELHLVHYNTKFPNVAKALESGERDALAVLGVFFTVGHKDNLALNSITNKLNAITFKNQQTSIEPFDLQQLVPSSKPFYRYFGSLTTPTCDQSVIWTVFTSPNYLSQTQLNSFLTLHANTKESQSKVEMSNNYRPVQPINDRVVFLLL